MTSLTSNGASTAVELPIYAESELQRIAVASNNDAAVAQDDVAEASRALDSSVPDGGYGWVVLFGCSVISWWVLGIPYSWGILQASLVEQGLSSPSTLSFVGSLALSWVSVLAIVNARLIQSLGPRWTCAAGVCLLGLGEILSGFTTRNLGGLFVTNGVVFGIGNSLCFITMSITPSQYFSKKRGLANGVVFGAGGIGATVMSFLAETLCQKHGPSWAFRVIGILAIATGLPASYLMKERVPIARRMFIDRRLFYDMRFLVLFIAGLLGTFPLLVPPFFIPLYAKSIGFSSTAGAGLVAGFMFASSVGRIGCGYLCDAIGPVNSLFSALAVSAISMLTLWPVSSTLAPLIAFTVINGAANGGFFSTMPTVVGNVFGSARVSVAMGMVVTGWGAGYLLGAPIAGYLLDAYGGESVGLSAYRPAMFYAGSMALGATGMVATARFKIDKKLLRRV